MLHKAVTNGGRSWSYPVERASLLWAFRFTCCASLIRSLWLSSLKAGCSHIPVCQASCLLHTIYHRKSTKVGVPISGDYILTSQSSSHSTPFIVQDLWERKVENNISYFVKYCPHHTWYIHDPRILELKSCSSLQTTRNQFQFPQGPLNPWKLQTLTKNNMWIRHNPTHLLMYPLKHLRVTYNTNAT